VKAVRALWVQIILLLLAVVHPAYPGKMGHKTVATSTKEVMFSLALVCLLVNSQLVSRTTQKLLDQLSLNSAERWHMGCGRNR